MYRPPEKLHEITAWPTRACNLRCKYCFVNALYPEQARVVISKETADELLRFAERRLQPNGNIWFFGGEPLLAWGAIKYIVEKAVANGFQWRFGATTNATLVTPERARWMRKRDFSLLVSLDGSKLKHDRYRVFADGRGSWDYAVRGLEAAKKAGVPVSLRWTFGPDTVEGMADDLKRIVEELKITNVAVDAVYEVEWSGDALEQLRRELEVKKRYFREWYARGIPVFSMFVRDAYSALASTQRPWISRCGLGEGTVGSDPEGYLYPCHRFVSGGELKIGSFSDGFWEERLHWIEKWRRMPPYSERPGKCDSCPFRKACNGGCLAVNWDLFGDPHVVPETFCEIKKLTVEVFRDFVREMKDNPTFRQLYAGSAR